MRGEVFRHRPVCVESLVGKTGAGIVEEDLLAADRLGLEEVMQAIERSAAQV